MAAVKRAGAGMAAAIYDGGGCVHARHGRVLLFREPMT